MTHAHSVRKKLGLESLEAKQLLAGDVLVSVVGGNLVVQGDELDNQIAIHSGPEPGQYIVQGLDGTNVMRAGGPPGDGNPGDGDPGDVDPGEGDPGGDPTGPDRAVVVHGVQRGARIRMGDGNDLVVVNEAQFAGNVSIRTGRGEDHVLVGRPLGDPPGPQPLAGEQGDDAGDGTLPPDVAPNVIVGGSLQIRTGADSDHVHVGNAAVGRRLLLGTGGGDDTAILGLPEAPNPPDPGGTADAAGGADDSDGPRPSALHVGGAVGVGLGRGNDHLSMHRLGASAISANGGQGDDALAAHDTNSRLLLLRGGLGDGADTVNVQGVHAQVGIVHTGGGDDEAAVIDSAFGMLGVGMGAGNDQLALGGVHARVARLAGGPGEEDILRGLGENMIAHRRLTGFELPPIDNPNGDENEDPVV